VLFDGPLMETSVHKAHSRKLTIVRLVASWASVDMLLSLKWLWSFMTDRISSVIYERRQNCQMKGMMLRLPQNKIVYFHEKTVGAT
jgi:hypothetical protein